MAIDITIQLNDEREATLDRVTAERNASVLGEAPVTSTQWLRQFVRTYLDQRAAEFSDRDRLTLREAYKLATPQEQAQIDAILNRYRR